MKKEDTSQFKMEILLPFISEDIFDCYKVTREQVLAVEGAKEWFIETYLELFKTDDEIGNYLKK